MAAVAAAAKGGTLRADDELHLTPLAAEEEDSEVAKLRTALDRRIGEAQLPELILSVDADVRFSWIMLGREPRSTHELLMVYAGILAHGTSLSAAGFDLCPRLKALKDRHLFLPRGTPIPASVQEICRASVDLERISSHWEQIVHRSLGAASRRHRPARAHRTHRPDSN